MWQRFGFNFRRPLPLWYFYWGSLYKPLVNYWGQPTFILKMRPNIKTFPNWKDHQTVWKHKRIFFNLQNTTAITNNKHMWYVVVFHQGVAMKIQKKEEFLQIKDNCDICWLTGGGTDQNIAWPVSWHGQVFTISDGVNIIIVITIVKDIKVWINAVFTWWGWLISAGYDHVPWLDRSHSRFHEHSRVHHNSKEEWSPIAIQHFHFTGWRQCTKASQASYSVSVERIFKMALISFVSSSCLYSFWLRCPLRCEDGASEAGERIRGEPIDKRNIHKLISEINIPSASDSVTIALTGKASFCHKWKGIMCDLVERLANWAF